MGTDRPEATMVYTGFFTEILAANPINPLKLTLVYIYVPSVYRFSNNLRKYF
jgi:hypothetical protein